MRITIDTHRLLILRRRRGKMKQGWCRVCGEQTEMLAPGQAAVIAGVSCRTIFRWVEAERVHFIEAAEEGPRICLNSLLRASRDRSKNNPVSDRLEADSKE